MLVLAASSITNDNRGMSHSPETFIDVECGIVPEDRLRPHDPKSAPSYPYLQIVRINNVIIEPGIEATSSRVLSLPPIMARRVLECSAVIATNRYYNCNFFTRVMRGLAPAQDNFSPDFLRRAYVDFDELTPTEVIPIGVAGIVGRAFRRRFDPERAPHSFIGLGTHESIQVGTNGGVLGLVDNASLLEFYRGYIPKEPTCLYEVPDEAFVLESLQPKQSQPAPTT